jgi:phage tail-like protein
MAIVRERPYLNGNFQVDLGTGDVDSVRAAFTQVILPDATVLPVEYRAGSERGSESRQLPGAVQYTHLVLRRGLIGETDLYEWWSQARSGDPAVRRNVTVGLLSENRGDVVWRWRFTNAWPTKYTTSSLDAGNENVVLEEIELAFERMEID